MRETLHHLAGRRTSALTVAVPAACLLAACGAESSGAPPSSALRTASVAAAANLVPGRPSAGADVVAARVRVTIRNVGTGRAARSTLGLYLSRDRRRGGGDRVLGLADVGSVPPGGRVDVRVPASAPAGLRGRWWVLACADVRRRVRETAEDDNCRASRRRLALAGPADSVPPRFAGLLSATRCSPGPATSARIRLEWAPAKDNATPAARMVYDVFRSTSAGQELGRPAYTTSAGATTFSTPPLDSGRRWYFVVRARDEAGNRDANTVRRVAEDLCD